MKHKIYILVFLILLFSCRKEAPVMDNGVDQVPSVEQPEETVYDYLNNYEGEFINGWMPGQVQVSSDCPEVISASGNAYVIPGGNNKLSVKFNDAEDDVNAILYGVVGAYGYIKVPVPETQDDAVSLVIILSQVLKKSSFIIMVSVEDAKGNISSPYYISVVLKSAQPGNLQICLSFDQHNDLDLHLIEPDGFEIYWHDTISPNGGILEFDANANCVYDSSNNENIYYTNNVPLGCFEVDVIYYKQCIYGVNTNFTVTALYNGQPISLLNGDNPFSATFPDGYEGWGIKVMEFDVGNISRIANFQYARYGNSIIKQEIVTVKPLE
jgi:hypothetical protein